MSNPIGPSINPTDPSLPFDTPSTFYVNSGSPDVLELANAAGESITRLSTDPSGSNAILAFFQAIGNAKIEAKDILYQIAQQQASASVQLQQSLLDLNLQRTNALANLQSFVTSYTALVNNQNDQISNVNQTINQLNSYQAQDAAAVNAMQTAIAQKNAVPPEISNSDFNQAVSTYNAYITTRNSQITTANNTTIASYNQQVAANNAAINQLNNLISSTGISNVPTQATYAAIPLLPSYTQIGNFSPQTLNLVSSYAPITQSTIDGFYASYNANFIGLLTAKVQSIQTNIQGINQNLSDQVNLLIRRNIITPEAFIDLSKKLTVSLGTGGVGLSGLASGLEAPHLAGQLADGLYKAIMKSAIATDATGVKNNVESTASAIISGASATSLTAASSLLAYLQQKNGTAPGTEDATSLQALYSLFLSNSLNGDAINASSDANVQDQATSIANAFLSSVSLSQGLSVLGDSPLASLLSIALINSLSQSPVSDSETDTETLPTNVSDQQQLQQIVQKQQDKIVSNLLKSHQEALERQAKLAAEDAVKYVNTADEQKIVLNRRDIVEHLAAYGFVGSGASSVADQFTQNIYNPSYTPANAASQLTNGLIAAFNTPLKGGNILPADVLPAVQKSVEVRLQSDVGDSSKVIADEFVNSLFNPANPNSSLNQVRDAISKSIDNGNDKLAEQQVKDFTDLMQPMTSLFQSSQAFLTPTGLITHGDQTSIWNKRVSQANAPQNKDKNSIDIQV